MGRWAQRRRGRGGGGGGAQIAMTLAATDGPNDLLVSFSASINSGDFVATDFTSQPSTTNPAVISQESPATLRLTFGVDISADTDLDYNGTVPDLLSPQTIAIT